jgi:glutathione peroxidase
LEAQTGKAPTWNFCKYLISADGEEISFYPSSVNPVEIAEKL